MEIIIKNMVCPRCIEVVSQIFKGLELVVIEIQLGKVILKNKISSNQKEILKKQLAAKGFQLLDDKHSQLINKIKSIIIQQVHYEETPTLINFSSLLSEQLNFDYTYLSRLFSSVEGQTIERYILTQKIEKVKELLTYDEMTIAEIAYQLHYSSPAHLSSQFKKMIGMSPSAFKKLQFQERKSLDKL